MKTAEEITKEIYPYAPELRMNQVLKQWAHEIIDEVRQEIVDRVSDREWEDVDDAIEAVKQKL